MKATSKIKTVLLLLTLSLISCSEKINESLSVKVNLALEKSGKNRVEINKALNKFSGEKKEAMSFLIAYMPIRDLKSLSSNFLIKNVDLAYITKKEFPWVRKLSKDIFFNEVLPYASLNEDRDLWRANFYSRFKKYVKDVKNIEDAIWKINKNIKTEIGVEYNTNRKKPDQNPTESIEQGMASCTGLSILLVDAFRSVGIPARVVGTPNWYNNSGNHNWVEVYVDGQWHFTEYYPSGKFDESWFLERAAKANINNKEQCIYASSYKSTGVYFPLVWDEGIRYVNAKNVTDRYINLYKKQLANDIKAQVQIVMLKDKTCSISGNNRIKTKIYILEDDSIIKSGFTSGAIDDMNKFLNFRLEKNKMYTIRYLDKAGSTISKKIEIAKEDRQIVLYFN